MAEFAPSDKRRPEHSRATVPLLTPTVRRTVQIALLGILIALVGVLVWQIQQLQAWKLQTIDTEFLHTQDDVRKTAEAIDNQLRSAMSIAGAVAKDLETGRLQRFRTPERLRAVMEASPEFGAIGVAFEPSERRGSNPDRRLYAPAIIRRGKETLDDFDLAARINYTDFKYRWYRDPLFHGPMWVEPHVHAVTGKVVAQYAVPFRHADRGDSPGGVATVSYPIAAIKKLINGLGLGRAGYAYLLSREGRFVIHPRNEEVRAGNTLFADAMKREDVALYSLTIRAIKGEAGFIDHSELGQSARIFFEPIRAAGWSLVVVHDKDELLDANRIRGDVITAIILATIASICFIALLGSLIIQGELLAWSLVFGFSALCIAAIGAIWATAALYPQPAAPTLAAFEIHDESTLHRYLNRYEKRSTAKKIERPVYIPTGVFVQSIELTSAFNVVITGYVWQHYRKALHRGVVRGFILPEAVEPKVNIGYHRPVGDCPALVENRVETDRDCTELIGWYFTTELRQSFDYSKYPFDRQQVWLRLWHTEFDRNIILTPDLESYESTNPVRKPGVEEDFVLPGWHITGSEFHYRHTDYNTNFGIAKFVGQSDFPELYFNIDIKRNFLGPFVSKITALFVVAAMLFAILLIGSKEEKKAGWFGFSAKDVVLGAAALFFVVIFDHASLRNSLASNTIMYLEYFYFGLYLAIMFVSINAIVFASSMKTPVVDYRDNLIPKLVFWPLYMVTMLAVTILVFR